MSTEKKKGRPLSGEKPLVKDLKVRVDLDTYKILSYYSELNNITIAETARRGISDFCNKIKK